MTTTTFIENALSLLLKFSTPIKYISLFIIILLIIFYIVKRALFSIAKSNRLIVTRVQRKIKDNQGHILDIDQEFIKRMDAILLESTSEDTGDMPQAPSSSLVKDVKDKMKRNLSKKQQRDVKRNACRVMSLSDYLSSLEYHNDEATAKSIVSALLHALSGGATSQNSMSTSLMPILPLIPSHLLTLQGVNPSVVARFTTTEFPSMLVAAAAIDAITQMTTKKSNPEENLPTHSSVTDSINRLVFGEEPGLLPLLPVLPNPLILGKCEGAFAETIDEIVEKYVKLGDEPDSYRYATPIPFAPELLPGLCVGAGGISPGQTPREIAKNRVMCIIFNKLAANSLALAGYQYHVHHEEEDKNAAPKVAPIDMFKIIIDGELEITNTTQLLEYVLPEDDDDADDKIKEKNPYHKNEEGVVDHVDGRGARIDDENDGDNNDDDETRRSYNGFIRTNVTSFGIMLCVRDKDPPTIPDSENKGWTTNEKARRDYIHIPLACCARTGVTDPTTGESVKQLSVHSGLALEVFKSNIFGSFYVTFYTGIEGFTGFHPGSELLRPWVWESHLIEPLNHDEVIRAFKMAAISSALANLTVRVYSFPMGGYGGLGVCNDSVAVIENAIKGRTRIFPLLARADAKCAMITTSRENFQNKLRNIIDKDPEHERKEEIEAIISTLDEIIQSLMTLPNDIQVEPDELPDAIDRIMACTMNSPFYHDQKSRESLPRIKKQWIDLLGKGTIRKTLDLRQEFRKRSASKWRIDTSS